MANRIFLDNVDITEDLREQQGGSTLDSVGQFVPAGPDWFDLMLAISKHDTLKNSFFTSNIHTLTIESDSGASSAKMFIKAKYSARNR